MDDDEDEPGYTLVTRINRCRRWLDDILSILDRRDDVTSEKRDALRARIVGIERKIRDAYVELDGQNPK